MGDHAGGFRVSLPSAFFKRGRVAAGIYNLHDCSEWTGREEYPQPSSIERVAKKRRLGDAVFSGGGRGSPTVRATWAIPVNLEPILDPFPAQPRFEGGGNAHQASPLKYMPGPATQAKAVISGGVGPAGVILDRQQFVASSALDAPVGLQKFSRRSHPRIMSPAIVMSIETREIQITR